MRFCITGTGRCGTSLLRGMLDGHPQVFVFPETHWIPKMVEFFGTSNADVKVLKNVVSRTLHANGKPVTPFDEAELDAEIAGRSVMPVAEFADLLGFLHARRNGKEYWADKTPDYGPYLQQLQLLWPECRIVHLVRNGLEVALSMSRHEGFRHMAMGDEMWWVWGSFNHYFESAPLTERELGAYLDLWYWRYLRIENERTRLRPGSSTVVRFEQLLTEPEVTLRQLADFCGLDAPESWLSEAASRVAIGTIQSKASEFPREYVEPRHQELLSTLGYGAGRPSDEDREVAGGKVEKAGASYFIKDGYRVNPSPRRYFDTVEDSRIYQDSVYRYAHHWIQRSNSESVLDLGCGAATKLEKWIAPTGAHVMGVDLVEAIEFCARTYDFGRWLADDIEKPSADLGTPFDLILCVDVVEHLKDPDLLFRYLRRWSHSRTSLILSTPERDLRRGVADMGPPDNPTHVREWNAEEFGRYLESHGLEVDEHLVLELRPGIRTCQVARSSWTANAELG